MYKLYYFVQGFIETRQRPTLKKGFWSLPSFDTPLSCPN